MYCLRYWLLPAILIGVPLTSGGACGRSAPDPNGVVVVYSSRVAAYAEAVQGIRSGMGGASHAITLIELGARSGEADLRQMLTQNSPRLVIAVGLNALNALVAAKVEAPVLSAMTMRSEGARAAVALRVAGAVYVDASPSGLLAEFKAAFPGKTRIGIIRNQSGKGPGESSWQALAKQGFTIRPVNCAGPKELLKAFLSLKGKVDFVLCLPDGSLYNNATVKPLILASLKNRLPIIGFSASFVRAGAAVGVYPDFRDLGRQTAEAARRYLAGQAAIGDLSPRKLKVCVNQRVLRLIGLNYKPTRSDVETFR